MKKLLLFCLTLGLVFSTGTSAFTASNNEKSNYSIKMLEYAGNFGYPVSAVIYGAHNQGTTDLPFFYNLIQGNGHNILFDVGFREDPEDGQIPWSTLFPIENIESPQEILHKVGLTPEDIDTVFLSHLHFDHAGNIDQFPNATFYIQKAELDGWLNSITFPKKIRDWLWLATDIDHFNDLLIAASEDRLKLLGEEKVEVLDGITAYSLPGHTFGTQGITVETKNGRYALAQDVVYTYKNLEDSYKPLGLGFDNLEQLISMDILLNVVDGNIERVIPGHDLEVFNKFPTEKVGKNRVVTIVE